MLDQKRLTTLFENFVNKNDLPKAILKIEDPNRNVLLEVNHGEIEGNSPFALASVTKLFTTTLILQLIDEEKITYNSIVTDFIPVEKIARIHKFRDDDYTGEITIADLLFQKSGLPNIFYEEPVKLRKRVATEDFEFTFSELVEWVRQTESHFVPDSLSSYYADINFVLLGRIAEIITHKSIDDLVDQRICQKLGLINTFVASNEFVAIPPLFVGDRYLKRPKLISSGGAAGGGVSTADDLMTFIHAFISGKLFDIRHWQKLKQYFPLQEDYAPVYYGGGHMKLIIGQYDKPERLSFIGHSGLSGAFAFYCPQFDLYLSGTTDNAKKSELCIQLLYMILLEIENELKK